MKRIVTKIIAFMILALYVLGVIGGVGYCLMGRAFLIAVGVIIVALLAIPSLLFCWAILTDNIVAPR